MKIKLKIIQESYNLITFILHIFCSLQPQSENNFGNSLEVFCKELKITGFFLRRVMIILHNSRKITIDNPTPYQRKYLFLTLIKLDYYHIFSQRSYNCFIFCLSILLMIGHKRNFQDFKLD